MRWINESGEKRKPSKRKKKNNLIDLRKDEQIDSKHYP